ncbi:MAG: MFS transporter, partial [Dehalococcoidia bacterium]
MSREIGLEKSSMAPEAEVPTETRPRRFGPWSKIHTFDSLKERNYRWFWLGMLGSFSGMQMQLLARGWLVVDDLNGSALDLGLVYTSFGLPILLFSLFSGVVTDRVDKRMLLVYTQGSIGLVSLAVAVLIATDHIQMWHVFVSAF